MNTTPWTIASVLKWATDDFRTRGIESPRLDAEILLAFALGATRVDLIVDASRPLEGGELTRFRQLITRRRVHEPVAYLLGQREFYGRMFRVDERVLIPRPDTETLVDVALRRTQERSLAMRAIDVGTGSGAIAITLARERPTSGVLAVDVSEAALAVARDNAMRLGAYNVGFLQGDLFQPLTKAHAETFDVVVSNLPYIPSREIAELMADVRDFEPRLALDGGGDGLVLVRRLVQEATTFLRPEGVLALEVGFGQAPEVASLLEAQGYQDVAVTRDHGAVERVVSGCRGRV